MLLSLMLLPSKPLPWFRSGATGISIGAAPTGSPLLSLNLSERERESKGRWRPGRETNEGGQHEHTTHGRAMRGGYEEQSEDDSFHVQRIMSRFIRLPRDSTMCRLPDNLQTRVIGGLPHFPHNCLSSRLWLAGVTAVLILTIGVQGKAIHLGVVLPSLLLS